MSVEQLRLDSDSAILEINKESDKFYVSIAHNEYAAIYLDRNQAHLLMLYLQEHLK